MATNKQYEEMIRTNPGAMVDEMVSDLLKQKTVDIHFEEEEDEPWAMVKVHKEDDDQEIGVRFQSPDLWVLQFGYYDEDDEFIDVFQTLTPDVAERMPEALRKFMRKVLASEEGMRVPGNVLGK